MDIKSKNIRYSRWFKLLAVIVCACGAVAAALGSLRAWDFNLAVTGVEYAHSESLVARLSDVYDDIFISLFTYTTEESIQDGSWINPEKLHEATSQARNDYNWLLGDAESRYGEMIAQAQTDGKTSEVYSLQVGKKDYLDRIARQYEEDCAIVRQEMISVELSRFRQAQKNLTGMHGLYYYANTADGIDTNIGNGAPEIFFKRLPAYHMITYNGSEESMPLSTRGYARPPYNATAWVGMSKELYDAGERDYAINRTLAMHSLWWFCGGLLGFLLGLGWLAYAAGRSVKGEGVRLAFIDRVYADIGCAIAFFILGVCFSLLYSIISGLHWGTLHGSPMLYASGAALAVCIALISALYLASAARRMKQREFVRHTLLYAIYRWSTKVASACLAAGRISVLAAASLACYAAVSAVTVTLFLKFLGNGNMIFIVFLLLFLLFTVSLLYCIARWAAAFRKVLHGTQQIKAGNLDYRIELTGNAGLTKIAENINNIAEGMNVAMEGRMKAERMRTELITNVSHDLKTPLTSIITYIDLLKDEGPGGGNVAKYVDVLDAKARRLKALTDDLFEAAKAASGSIVPSMAQLDIVELLSQGLGELEDRIKESGLDFRVSLPKVSLHVLADGKLLWRVIENLISNVIKYALPNSRVYVIAACDQGLVRIEIKNISAYELNIPAEDLTERFIRGDQSRGSEGSGLGLAIAKNLTELQGGRFKIEVDGDLFKAVVEFREDR